MSSSAHSPGSLKSAITWPIVSGETTPDRPSEHSIQRSPTTASRIVSSGATSACASPRIFRTTLRLGWCSASSGVIWPVSTRYCTKEWSVVTCVSVSPRST